jgi:hypothetical protein
MSGPRGQGRNPSTPQRREHAEAMTVRGYAGAARGDAPFLDWAHNPRLLPKRPPRVPCAGCGAPIDPRFGTHVCVAEGDGHGER